jgi:hypothetical protein
MKSNFRKSYVEHFPRLPAEACSELGYMSKPRRHALWVSRFLEVTRRWFAGGERAPGMQRQMKSPQRIERNHGIHS